LYVHAHVPGTQPPKKKSHDIWDHKPLLAADQPELNNAQCNSYNIYSTSLHLKTNLCNVFAVEHFFIVKELMNE